MSIVSRIAKKIARRFRRKGTQSSTFLMSTKQRWTARTLWEANFKFGNPTPERAGWKRATARLNAIKHPKLPPIQITRQQRRAQERRMLKNQAMA